MSQRITLKEFALLAGVSPSTISKALNNYREISPPTRRKIKKMALELGYTPHIVAKGLKTQKTGQLAVILPNIKESFFMKALDGIESRARKRNYKILLSVTNESLRLEREQLLNYSNGGVDGILLCLSKQTQKFDQTDHVTQIVNKGIPLILFDRVSQKINCEKVIIDDCNASFCATKKLIESGVDQLFYATGISGTSVDEFRKQGFKKAIEQLAPSTPYAVLNSYPHSAIRKSLIQLLKKGNLLGILASDEGTAVMIQNFIIQNGYQVPNDVSIIGFTDGHLSKVAQPRLSVISQNAEGMGRKAVDRMLLRISSRFGHLKQKTNYINSKLILRQSTL